MALTPSRKKANDKFLKDNYSSICFRVKTSQAAQIKQYVASKGLSLRAYLLGLISQDMGDLLTVPGEAREPESGE